MGLIFGWIILGYIGVDLGAEAKEPAGLLLGQSDALFFETAFFGFALGVAQFRELLGDGDHGFGLLFEIIGGIRPLEQAWVVDG